MTEDPTPDHKDLEYHFGFQLAPFNITSPTLDSLPPSRKEKQAADRTLKMQEEYLANAQEVLKARGKKPDMVATREMVEAWNLADTEAWRFVRAHMAREKMERNKWEEEERAFAGAEEGRGKAWGNWFDKR
jgi:hypothetical protein